MNISPNSVFKQHNPYEQVIQELLQLDGRKKRQLQAQEQTLNTRKTAVSDIGSKLSSLNSLLTTYNDPTNNKLNPLTATSTNKSAVSVLSTSGLNNTGSYNISVSQLAKNDQVLSGSMSSSGTTLSSSGSASFTLSVGGSSASISVNTTGMTNKGVMNAIASQVNSKLGSKLKASVFDLGNGNSQLSFKSVNSGQSSYISFSNVKGDASSLNLSNQYSKSALDAKFTIDNVSFQRSSNKVSDAIQGMTFQLKQVTSQAATINATNDTQTAIKNIKSFIKKFNAANSIIRQKTHLNGKTGDKGPLQGDRSIRNLSYSLRQDASLTVGSMSGQSIQDLANIGIQLKTDGTMYIKDSSKLKNALQTSPQEVKQLFTASDGIIGKMQTTINQAITGSSNLLDTVKNGINRKISMLDKRISAQKEYLKQKETSLRQQYAQLLQTKSLGQNQMKAISLYQSQFGG
ncbi:MAG TPA: flagellar filament capping protein FliD [Balneolaceae bacterium]|nr:flagellar filament capping protein FliD [Balneolaceae bacterium]